MRVSILAGVSALISVACTSTPQVPVIEPRDTHFSCAEIASQVSALEAVMIEAHHNKGFNLANFFAVSLFPPAYYNNVLEADNAEEWVQRRRVMLTDLYIRKGCAPGVSAGGLASDAAHSATNLQSVYEAGVRNFAH